MRQEYVGAEVHVMMTIQPLWFAPIKTAKLLDLSRYQILKRTGQYRMKDRLREAVPQQVGGDFALAFPEFCGTIRCRTGPGP